MKLISNNKKTIKQFAKFSVVGVLNTLIHYCIFLALYKPNLYYYNNLLLDFRFQKQFANRSTLYIEQSPFLNKHALYNFFIFEHPLWYKFNIGGETENILKAGKNSLGAGPRISRPLGTIGKTKVVMALSYRMRPQEPDELRLYLVFNVPLRLKH